MSLVRAALAAADPWTLVREKLSLSEDSIRIVHSGLKRELIQNIYVIGAGKAGAPMAAAVEDAFGDLITDGLVIVKDGYRTVETNRIEIIEAAHPVPDARAATGARRILEMAGRAGDHDLVICLISGGGSALMTLPAGELSLEDVQQTTSALLRSGAPIDDINAVRKHLTLASGGRVAMAAGSSMVVTLIISDVIGDDLSVIASGPTFPDWTTYGNALTVLESRGLLDLVSARVIAHLEAGVAGTIAETPKPGRRHTDIFKHCNIYILGSNRTALDAAAAAATQLGYEELTLDEPVTGEARDAAIKLVDFSRKHADSGRDRDAGDQEIPPVCVLAGGETTVTVTGNGLGGRAQEFALAAALAIEGREDTLAFAFGTDGTDGPTDAAGAIADGTTTARARALGLDPERHLRENDAYPFFRELGDLIITGPTGTNVNDIYGVLIAP
jgi:hydroxypyruvate reductase